MPFDRIFEVINGIKAFKFMRHMRFLRYSKLGSRAVKIIRLRNINRLAPKDDDANYPPGVIKLTKLFFVMAVTAHFAGCYFGQLVIEVVGVVLHGIQMVTLTTLWGINTF
eukprot:UN04705